MENLKTGVSEQIVGKPLKKVPQWRVWANIFKTARNPIPTILEDTERMGPIYTVKTFIGNLVIMADPEYAQHVLQKGRHSYKKSRIQTEILAGMVGDGLLTSEGDYWLRQRRLIQPGFHRDKIAALHEIMLEETNQHQENLQHKAGQILDISQEMMKLTFKIVARSLFSSALKEEELERVGTIVNELQHYIVTQARRPYKIPFWKLLGKVKYYERIKLEADSILYKVIRERKASGEKKDDLLDMLLEARYEDNGEGMTEKQILDESNILFIAGHETTANAMTWILYLLGTHPEIFQKLKTEAEEVIGDKDVAFEDLRSLTYNYQVIQEGMRLYPPAWAIDRVVAEEDVVDGYTVPQGSFVILFVYGIHHNKAIWGDPEVFRPERFSEEEMKDKHRYAFFPFGGGPRLCIGNNFAMMEMQIILAQFVRKLNFIPIQNQKVEHAPMVTLRPRNGIKVKVVKS